MPMTFRRSWDFNQGNKPLTKNDLRDDQDVKDLIDSAGYDDTVLTGRITDAETDIIALQGDITALAATDASLDSRVDALELGGGGGGYDDTVIVGRMDAAEADITALQAADTSLDSRVDALEAGGGGGATENISVTLTAATEYLYAVTIQNDGTDSSTWPNRFAFTYKPNLSDSVGAHLTSWHNEYGELRGTSAKTNTVAARFFTKDQDSDTDHDASTPVLEVVNSRDVRTELFGVMGDGLTYATEMEVRVPSGPTLQVGYKVLDAVEAVPAGTPANTLIVRTT